MKKLVVLTLVLGMASLANAGLVLAVDGVVGNAEVNTGAVAQIGVWNDTAGPGAGHDNFLHISTGADATWTGDTGFPSPPGFGGTATYLGLNDLGAGLVDIMELNTGVATADPYGVGVISFADYLAGSTEEEVTITLLDDGFGYLDSITITQVPEPVTMALLGLGGLFLRRRK